MNYTLHTPHRPQRFTALAITLGLHVLAVLGLIAIATPAVQQFVAAPLRISLVSPTPKKESQPEPPKPLPMKSIPRPVPTQPRETPQPVAAPILHSTAPVADAPALSAPPTPLEAPPAQAPTRVAPAAPAVVETVQPPRHDADHLFNPKPDYPRASQTLGEEGKVGMRVLVSETGRPLQVLIAKSSGFARLDNAARTTVTSSWRFEPARRGDRPISEWVAFTIEFELNKR